MTKTASGVICATYRRTNNVIINVTPSPELLQCLRSLATHGDIVVTPDEASGHAYWINGNEAGYN